MIHDYLKQKKIEAAIKFLIDAIHKSGHNPKPVILHSLRVAFYLDNLGYKESIIISAILHDILEDAEITVKEIESKFGSKVAGLVSANTFRKDITDDIKCYKELFNRCLSAGRDALIIKAADILDNSNYYNHSQPLLKKMEYFIGISEPYIKDEKVLQDLVKQYNKLSK